jgi:tetratricopeptide (TPR) repeat protein
MHGRLPGRPGAAAILAGLTLAALVGPAIGDPGRSVPPAAQSDSQYAAGERAVKRGDYAEAIRLFEAVVAREERNADALNMLAYSIRKSGDPARAIPLYQKALQIDPKHRGAHEYIGEAYLMLGDLPRAREHLAALDKLCVLPCGEYTDLKKAVQRYESSQGQTRPGSKGTQ